MTETRTYWTKSELKTRRGWTDQLIKKILGEPDFKKCLPITKYQPKHCYDHQRVLDSEENILFKKHQNEKKLKEKLYQANKELTATSSAGMIAEDILNRRLEPQFLNGHSKIVDQVLEDYNAVFAESDTAPLPDNITLEEKQEFFDKMLRLLIKAVSYTHLTLPTILLV